jgi:hypothetical protein
MKALNKFVGMSLCAALVLSAAAPAYAAALKSPAPSAGEQTMTTLIGKKHRRNLGLGVLGAVGAAVIINEAAKAEEREYRREERFYEARRCRVLYSRCQDGDDRACDRFDDYC